MNEETRAPFIHHHPLLDTGLDSSTLTDHGGQDSLQKDSSTALLPNFSEVDIRNGEPKTFTNFETYIKIEDDSDSHDDENSQTEQSTALLSIQQKHTSLVQTDCVNTTTTFTQTCNQNYRVNNENSLPELYSPLLFGTLQRQSKALVQTEDSHEIKTSQTCISIDTESDENSLSELSGQKLLQDSESTDQSVDTVKDTPLQTCIGVDIGCDESSHPYPATRLHIENDVANVQATDGECLAKDTLSSKDDGYERPDTTVITSNATPATAAGTEEHWRGNLNSGNEVVFLVGQGRQPMTARDSDLAAISPAFSAMLSVRWRKTGSGGEGLVEIPLVDAESFAVILRHISQADDLQLKEKNVWDVLNVADMYQVFPVVDQCFHFLLHKHSRHQKSSHICVTLEKAHHLNYPRHYEDCMKALKQKACKVLKNASALSELCQECMLKLVMSQDLAAPEILIHDAMVTWTRRACGETSPSLGKLRVTAGQLTYHIRYLIIPRASLKNLGNKDGQISCLLTDSEMCSLLNGDVRNFPETIDRERQSEHKTITEDLKKKMDSTCTVIFLVGLVVLFLFAILYIPINYVIHSLSADSDER